MLPRPDFRLLSPNLNTLTFFTEYPEVGTYLDYEKINNGYIWLHRLIKVHSQKVYNY